MKRAIGIAHPDAWVLIPQDIEADFRVCLLLQSVPLLNAAAVTTAAGMFQNCPSFETAAYGPSPAANGELAHGQFRPIQPEEVTK